jgi:nucleoid DNA-binding protein
MTKQELIKRVARRLPGEISRKIATALVEAVFAELGDYFVEARDGRRAARFSYPGFGTFTRRRRGARAGRHPRTGEPITIPASTTLVFQPGLELRGELNREPARRKRAEVE